MEEEVFEFPFDEEDTLEKNVAKRNCCLRCMRPTRVCICSAFPARPVDIKTQVHILQHPKEQEMRQLTTVPLLQECLPKDKCNIYRGRRFSDAKFEELHKLSKSKNTVLLFPSTDAIPIEEYIKTAGENVDLFVLDGTWREAKSIYYHCKFLHDVKKVKITGKWKSEFVIRTQPDNDSVSTLEAIAIALSQFENNPEIIKICRKPLKALCDIQLEHGAQAHHSKEELASLGLKYKNYQKKKK